jgi:hypothetical protein
MDEAEVAATGEHFHKAVRDRCRPSPVFDIVRFKRDARFVLAVNVWPSLAAPVAVQVHAIKEREGFGGEAWVFPIRVGSHSKCIPVESLAMYMTPQLRRNVLLLNKIDTNAKVYARFRANSTNPAYFDSIDEENNVVRFRDVDGGPVSMELPLDGVLSVYRNRDGWWITFDL